MLYQFFNFDKKNIVTPFLRQIMFFPLLFTKSRYFYVTFLSFSQFHRKNIVSYRDIRYFTIFIAYLKYIIHINRKVINSNYYYENIFLTQFLQRFTEVVDNRLDHIYEFEQNTSH